MLITWDDSVLDCDVYILWHFFFESAFLITNVLVGDKISECVTGRMPLPPASVGADGGSGHKTSSTQE